MNEIEIVEKQLSAYNKGDYKSFAACYHQCICSYDLDTSELIPEMSATKFFEHYKNKFIENPSIYCEVIKRIFHGNLVVDQERITGHGKISYEELVIYEVSHGLISKMWFRRSK